MDNGFIRERLRAATFALKLARDNVEVVSSERDRLIAQARDARITWADIQDDTGLSRRAVGNVLKQFPKQKA